MGDYNHYINALEPLVRRVRTDATAKKGSKGSIWTRDALTPELLAQHVNGGPARGVCPIKAGESTTMVALLDLDSHKGESTWGEMADAALQVAEALEQRGLRPVPFRSSGGRGIHLYMIWDEPQDARSVRAALRDALDACGFKNGTAGVRNKQIEIFPKQDSVPADKFGNQFILPLAGASEPLMPMDMDPMGKDAAIGMAWPSSAPVPFVEAPVDTNKGSILVEDLGQLERALWAIPNNIDNRDEWFRLLCAFKEGGGDKEVARAWTEQYTGAGDANFDGPWDSITVGKDNGAPVDYLFRIAESHGWNELKIEEFPVIEMPEAEPEELEWPVFQRDSKGAIEPTMTNAVKALQRPDVCGVRIGYDEFKDTTLVAWGDDKTWRALRDTDYTRLRVELEARGFKKPGRELVRDAAMQVAEDNSFDSALQWADGLHWDGVARVDKFLERYAGAEAGPYSRAVSRYLWTALAARLTQPGAKCDMVPVLVGGQGTGKSTGVMAMAPEPDAYVEVNLEHRDDNLARALRGKLVGELGELRGLMTKDAEAIKAWITRTHEEWIPKYMEFATKFPRRLVFIGTTNSDEFLADDTGERRWLPVRVGTVDAEAIAADRDQLWAEGIALFRKEGLRWRDAMELAVEHHDEFKVNDAWAPLVRDWLLADEMDSPEGAPRGMLPFKLESVMAAALRLDAKSMGVREQKRVASILKSMGFTKRRATRAEGGKHIWEAAGNCKLFEIA